MTLLLGLFYFFKKVWRPLVMFCQQHMPRPESRPPHLHEHCSRLHTPLSMLNPKLSEKDARSPPARGEEMLTALSACCRQKELCNLHGAFPKVSPNILGNGQDRIFYFHFYRGGWGWRWGSYWSSPWSHDWKVREPPLHLVRSKLSCCAVSQWRSIPVTRTRQEVPLGQSRLFLVRSRWKQPTLSPNISFSSWHSQIWLWNLTHQGPILALETRYLCTSLSSAICCLVMHWFGLNCVPPKFMCRNPDHQCLRMSLKLGIASLKRLLS